MQKGTLYWITGLSGAGKTTIGTRLYYCLKDCKRKVVLLDGDVLKRVVGKTVSYSRQDRLERAYQYSSLCALLVNQGLDVVICTIAMYDEVRDWNRRNTEKYIEIFLDVEDNVLQARNKKGLYMDDVKSVVGKDIKPEFPKTPDIIINNNGSIPIDESVKKIMQLTPKQNKNILRETEYWNKYYSDRFFLNESPSLFAEYVKENYIKQNDKILELGCGNGRDSVFFANNGIEVVAVDASDRAISMLKERTPPIGNIYFICDDFVNASAVYQGDYDGVYSRFTMHSISKQDQDKVIANVFAGLKENGLFMVEARTVNDVFYGIGHKTGKDTFFKDGHSRRFINKEEFENDLKSVGFEILFSEESKEFAPNGLERPEVLRIIAKKSNLS